MTGSVRVASRARKPAADFESRDARQHPVEDDEVGRVLGEPQLGLVAARHVLDHIAFGLEVIAQEQRQIGFVLDDENARRGGGPGTDDLLARLVHHDSPPASASMSDRWRLRGRSVGRFEPVTR